MDLDCVYCHCRTKNGCVRFLQIIGIEIVGIDEVEFSLFKTESLSKEICKKQMSDVVMRGKAKFERKDGYGWRC